MSSNPFNPEAGYSHMPVEPEAVEAALRASRISLRASPYYAFRFGTRGTRFSHSDSMFLASLPDAPERYVSSQVRWLGGILANRGMPTVLLESHLRLLARLLGRAVPEKKQRYATLQRAADELRAQRRAAVPEADELALRALFLERSGLPDTRLARGLGVLVVAAIADERAGHPNAVESLVGWFYDYPYADKRVREAMRMLVRRAA